ncbi:hypothetical protein PR003_g22483 [Phytophthora rubi]|uniref:Uncharacterized protein n=1 Tax=Phytophthora rubi TaxID=129364 RepID=A0A6A4D3X6_9STRA|nr:hypothetical protein PR003_g22483 [Phytophthora rubi]
MPKVERALFSSWIGSRRWCISSLIAVGHPTVPCGSTLGGDEDDVNDMTSAAHEPVTLNSVTSSKTKKALATPNTAASPLEAQTARTLIAPGNADLPTTRRRLRRVLSITPPFRSSSCNGNR